MFKRKILLVLTAIGIIATTSFADVAIDEKNFPDDNFRGFVKLLFDNGDDILKDDEIAAVTKIHLSSKQISDFTGLKYFTALTILDCSGNKLTTLDVSGLTNLAELECRTSQLTELDVSGLSNLSTLYCSDNQLIELDVSGLDNLTELNCANNQLTTLNVGGATNLSTLYCSSNQLTTLDVSGLTKLEYFSCYNNQLTEINVSALTNLSTLYCFDNQLTTLNVSGATNLSTLYCSDNQLTSLDVSGLTNLTDLDCSNNFMNGEDKVIGFTGNWDGSSFRFSPQDIEINETNFPDEKFRNWILEQTYGKDGRITGLEIAAVTVIDVRNKQISDLTGIEHFTALTSLYCFENQLTALDVSGLSNLVNLYCDNNQLSELNVSGLTNLGVLYCFDNQLSELDVSGFTNLEYLDCSYNQLTSLNVSGLTNLEYLQCHNNQLTSLNVSGLTNLEVLDCSGNQLTELDVSGLANLGYLYCNSNQLTELDVANNTALMELYCQLNAMSGEDKVIGLDKTVTTVFMFSPQKTNIASVELGYITTVYNGAAQEPKLSGLTEGRDYTIELHSENINAGTASVTVKGMGNYFGTDTKNFTITPKVLTVNATVTSKIYDGNTSAVISGAGLVGVVTGDEVSLVGATTGIFADKNVGDDKSVTVTMSLSGADAANYTLTQPTLTGTITAKPLANEMLTPIPNQIHTGEAVTPSVTVKDGETTLTEDTDYTVEYSNNTEEGTATVTVTGTGNYTAIATTSFEIVKGTTAIIDNNNSADKPLFKSTIVSDKMEIILNDYRNISFVVYDMTGNIVADGNGRTWDLRNSTGRFVANGAYLVVVEAKDNNGKGTRYSAKIGVKR